MKNLLTGAVAAFALTVSSIAVAAAPARSSAPVSGESHLAGEEVGLILALVIAAGTLFAVLSQDDDNSDSP